VDASWDTMQSLFTPDVIVAAAATVFVIAYLIINQVALRLTLLLGTALYIWYYFVAAQDPLWSAIWASGATGLANMIGLGKLWLRNSPISIPRRHMDVYAHFDILPPGDFRKLMRAATRQTRPAGYVLTRSNTRVETLYYVVNGPVVVEKYGESFRLPDGIFLGEVAYLTGNRASATTHLAADSDVIEWEVADLKRRAQRDVRFRLALDALISLDLADKVARAGSPKLPGFNMIAEVPVDEADIPGKSREEVLNLARAESR